MQLLFDFLVAKLLSLLFLEAILSLDLHLLFQVQVFLQFAGQLDVQFDFILIRVSIQIVVLVFRLGHGEEFDGMLPLL